MARRRLIDIELSPGGRIVRKVLFWTIAVCCGIATLTYIVPSHHLSAESVSHSGYADSGPIPLVGLAGITVLTAWLSRQRFGAGMIGAVVGGIASFFEFARTVFFHLFANVTTDGAEMLHVVALVGMFGACVLMLFIEPVLYWVERSSQERAEPTIPEARVVNT